MRKLLIVIWVFFISMEISSNAQVTFDSTYNVSSGLEFGWSVQILDSSYITLSNGINLSTGNRAFNFSKFSEEGQLTLNKVYIKEGFQYYVGLSDCLFPFGEGYVFGGNVVENTSNNSDVILVKFNNEGDTLFVKAYGNSDSEAPYHSILTDDNHFLLVGFKGPIGGDNDVMLIKTDTSGNLIWMNTYGGTETNIGLSVWQVAGHYYISAVKIISGDGKPWMIKTDTAGNIVNEKEFLDPQYICGGFFAPTIDHHFLYSSCMDTLINSGEDDHPSFIAKMDTDFNFIWKAFLNDQRPNGIYISKELPNEFIIYVGFQENGNPNGPEGWIGKVSKNGNTLWRRTFRHGTSTFNYFSDFQQTSDGGFIVTGSTKSSLGQDLWLVKLDSMGKLVEDSTITATFETTDEVYSLKCYPNPAITHTTILYHIPPQVKDAAIEIYNLHGVLMQRWKPEYQSTSHELDVSDWASGMYLVNLIAEGQRIKTQKLLCLH